MVFTYELAAGDFSRAGCASSDLKKKLKELNVPVSDMKRAVIALFEAEVNVVAHSFGGTLTAEISAKELHVVVADRGPGIPNIQLAMQEGFSTATDEVREMGYGAGMGLPNIQKSCDLLEVRSGPGSPTEVDFTIRFTGGGDD